ncbi:MAG TPA: hypothetical protein VJN43_07030 [Bryobacteraceae bacterium]|nr:hypothetical protein [Bryobacteraceae bacterium]
MVSLRVAAALTLLWPQAGWAAGCAASPLAVRVKQIRFHDVTRLTALVSAAQRYRVCLAIEGTIDLQEKMSIAMDGVSFGTFLHRVAPAHGIRVDQRIVHLRGRPAGVRTWLDFPIDFDTDKKWDAMLVSNFLLACAFKAQANPESGGILGDVLGQHDQVGPYKFHHTPVREILDRLVCDSVRGGAWVVRAIYPQRGQPPANMWQLLLYSDSLRINIANMNGTFPM